MTAGLLLIDKPAGPTSHDVVADVRRWLRRAAPERSAKMRVGHAGTLDPLATGLLVLCVGPATRLSEYLIGEDKHYRARVRFGVSTTTYDADGEITATRDVTLGRAGIETALRAFLGAIRQAPPAYSAIKRGGRKAYEAARRGEAVALEPRSVTIHAANLDEWSPPDATISVHCSAGTYVRSLAHDLGQKLGCGAHLAALRRLAVGRFNLDRAVTLGELRRAFGAGAWRRFLLPMEEALPGWPRILLDDSAVARLRQGRPVKMQQPAEGLAGAFDRAGRLAAIVEGDAAAGLWRPRKVL